MMGVSDAGKSREILYLRLVLVIIALYVAFILQEVGSDNRKTRQFLIRCPNDRPPPPK